MLLCSLQPVDSADCKFPVREWKLIQSVGLSKPRAFPVEPIITASNAPTIYVRSTFFVPSTFCPSLQSLHLACHSKVNAISIKPLPPKWPTNLFWLRDAAAIMEPICYIIWTVTAWHAWYSIWMSSASQCTSSLCLVTIYLFITPTSFINYTCYTCTISFVLNHD